MFSARANLTPDTNALSQALEARRGAGLAVVDLTETNPTRTQLAVPAERLVSWLSDPRCAQYEPEPFGLRTARQAVARYHNVSWPHVALTASTSEAYAWLFQLLCDPGDAVLVPTPSYPLFEHLARLQAVEVVPYASQFVGGEWQLDLHDLARQVTPRCKAVLLVTPNNPTGAAIRGPEREALVTLCAERGLALVSDEVFAETLPPELPDDRVRTLADETRCLTFVLSGLSKLALLPQLKCGWLVARGPDALVTAALARLELIADTYLSVATPVQLALPHLLAAVPGLQVALRERLHRHRQLLQQSLAGTAASVLPADGGWTALVRVPRSQPDEAWVLQLLNEHGVWVQPGWFYDLPEGHLVLSLLPEPTAFELGVAALRAVVCQEPVPA